MRMTGILAVADAARHNTWKSDHLSTKDPDANDA
jgi:hypothetical protein